MHNIVVTHINARLNKNGEPVDVMVDFHERHGGTHVAHQKVKIPCFPVETFDDNQACIESSIMAFIETQYRGLGGVMNFEFN